MKFSHNAPAIIVLSFRKRFFKIAPPFNERAKLCHFRINIFSKPAHVFTQTLFKYPISFLTARVWWTRKSKHFAEARICSCLYRTRYKISPPLLKRFFRDFQTRYFLPFFLKHVMSMHANVEAARSQSPFSSHVAEQCDL